MTSKERLYAAWNGKSTDHVPLTIWCFGLKPPQQRCWQRAGKPVTYWYSKRMEHLHTLPQDWTLEDDFQRAIALSSMGVDDILEVSVPWSMGTETTWQDHSLEDGRLLERVYSTPAGSLSHRVKVTGEDQGEGWVVQPDHVPLFEDFNIPRAAEQAVSSPADVPRIKHLYTGPDSEARSWFAERMEKVSKFAAKEHFPVQAWSAFGMDAVVWLTGTEAAILMAIDEPEAFDQLLDIITEADLARTDLAAGNEGVDMIVQRGWYSSTDFWSPALFDKFLFPRIAELAACTHRHGKKFAYVMTTGVEVLGPRLADAGVDVLYFVDPIDPIQGGVSLTRLRDLLGDRLTLTGGISALTLASGDPNRIEREVREAIEILGPTHRFILHPVDALFPDTPWEGVEQVLRIWQKYR